MSGANHPTSKEKILCRHRVDRQHFVCVECDDEEVESELALDRRIYGNCFWRVVNGRKVRIHPREVVMDSKGRIIAPSGEIGRE